MRKKVIKAQPMAESTPTASQSQDITASPKSSQAKIKNGKSVTPEPESTTVTMAAEETTQATTKRQRISQSLRGGLTFPVGRVQRYLKNSTKLRVTKTAGVYVSSVLEYLTAEVLEIAGDHSRKQKKRRIVPRHIKLGIQEDTDLDQLCRNITIPESGVLPHIEQALIPPAGSRARRSRKRKAEDTELLDTSSTKSSKSSESY